MRETMRELMQGVEHVGKVRKIDHNTVEYVAPNGNVTIRLHHTDVAVRNKDGSLTLNTGGWQTITTKSRLNSLLRQVNAYLYQSKGQWYISKVGADSTVPYFDGICVPQCFDDPKAQAKGEKAEAASARLSKKIREYVKRIPNDAPAAQMPGPGDCWHCGMFDRVERPGQKTRDPEHLLAHLKEGYVPGWLIVNALRWAGATDYAVQLAFSEGGYWNARNTVRRYLRAQLALPLNGGPSR